MRKTQLDYLCETFGNPELSSNEKWKSIKYIFVENPIVDVQLLINKNEIMYINNSDIGPGFYIMGIPNAEFGVPNIDDKVITFIPLKIIDKISLIASNIYNEQEFTKVINLK